MGDKGPAPANYPVTVSTNEGVTCSGGREDKILFGTTMEYSYAVFGTSLIKFSLRINKIDEDDFHATMGDQNIAEAIALQKAKELARVSRHDTDYGWPVVWKYDVCFQYRNLRSNVLQIDCRTDPRVIPIEEAKDFFSGQSFHGDRYQHFGLVPPKLLQDNFVPQSVSRTCDGRCEHR